LVFFEYANDIAQNHSSDIYVCCMSCKPNR